MQTYHWAPEDFGDFNINVLNYNFPYETLTVSDMWEELMTLREDIDANREEPTPDESQQPSTAAAGETTRKTRRSAAAAATTSETAGVASPTTDRVLRKRQKDEDLRASTQKQPTAKPEVLFKRPISCSLFFGLSMGTTVV